MHCFSRCRSVEEAVIAASSLHFAAAAAARTMSDLNDERARLCVEFDFFGQVGLDEERLGYPNPPRISDASRSASWLPFGDDSAAPWNRPDDASGVAFLGTHGYPPHLPGVLCLD
jgi:hypothetical protein